MLLKIRISVGELESRTRSLGAGSGSQSSSCSKQLLGARAGKPFQRERVKPPKNRLWEPGFFWGSQSQRLNMKCMECFFNHKK